MCIRDSPWGIVLVADRLAASMLLLTSLLALCALVYALGGSDRQGRHFHVLFQIQLCGLAGAFLTGDLFNLFVFFEILLIASYGLTLHGGGPQRTRAGLHYVVMNLLGSTVFLDVYKRQSSLWPACLPWLTPGASFTMCFSMARRSICPKHRTSHRAG